MKNIISNFSTNLKDKKKEILTTVLIFILLLPNFKLSIFDANGTFFDIFFNVGRVASGLFIIIYYFRYCLKNRYVSKPLIIYYVIQTFIFLNTFFQTGFSKDAFVAYMSFVITITIIDCFAHKNPKELILALLINFEILIFINFIFMIIYPTGMVEPSVHFLGNRNGHLIYFLLALTFALVWNEYGGSKIHFYALLVVILISSFIGKSTTGFFALLLFIFLYFTKLYKCKYVNFPGSIIFYIILFLSVVIFRVQDYLAPLWSLFDKNITFSGRTYIWDTLFTRIPEHLFLGYGRIPYEIRSQFFGSSSAHDFLLEQLVLGGLTLVAIELLFVVVIIYQIKDVKNESFTKYFILAIVPLMLQFLSESSGGALNCMIFFLLSHSKEFVNYKKQAIEQKE